MASSKIPPNIEISINSRKYLNVFMSHTFISEQHTKCISELNTKVDLMYCEQLIGPTKRFIDLSSPTSKRGLLLRVIRELKLMLFVLIKLT